MATITARRRGDGTTAYTAQIRIKQDGRVVHSEARTFAKRATARAWAAEREEQIRRDPAGATRAEHQATTVGELIASYVSARETVEPLGRTKGAHLALLRTFAISERPALGLSAADVIEHIQWRRAHGAGPATASNDLIWLRVVFRYARTALGVPLDMAVLDDAADLCRSERMIARPNRRRRRPTDGELLRITEWFARKRRGPPMVLIMWAAIYSCRRIEELCSMRLSDFDRQHRLWLIRDVKHPGGSAGNHREMLVTDRFLAVVDALIAKIDRPKGEDRLVPFNHRTVGTYWQRQMKVLGIEDLHFHDLRRHGCSLLAEEGKTIPEIQQVSLHESWGSLQIYVNMKGAPARAFFEPTCLGTRIL